MIQISFHIRIRGLYLLLERRGIMKSTKGISHNVINRLPRYLRYLTDIQEQGKERISSREIAEGMNTTPSQVRQDFTLFGSYGVQGYGYQVDFFNEERDTISPEDMKYIPDELKEVQKFYKDYKTRVIDYEANIEYKHTIRFPSFVLD